VVPEATRTRISLLVDALSPVGLSPNEYQLKTNPIMKGMTMNKIKSVSENFITNISRVIIGKRETIELSVVCLFQVSGIRDTY